MDTTSTSTTPFAPSPIDKVPSYSPLSCPAPAGQTPPYQHHNPGFVPSPIECASPNSGAFYHPATPMPHNPVFNDTHTSSTPSFIDKSFGGPIGSPNLCGPTPASTPVHPSFPRSPQPTDYEFATETFHTPTSSSTSYPASNSTQNNTASAPHLSTLKGNFTSFVGKVTHNPDKQHAGNTMIANRKEEKALFFEQKAKEWELKGETAKAQKNRDKAQRCRSMAKAKLQGPLTSSVNKTPIKTDKAAMFDVKAQEAERKGDLARATKFHNKAYALRQKHGLSQPIGGTALPTVAPVPAFYPAPVAPIPSI